MMERFLEHIAFLSKYTSSLSREKIALLILIELGFSPDRDSTRGLLNAIMMYEKDPSIPFSKCLYPSISPIESSFQAEQSIRTAIKTTWLRRNEELWNMYFFFLRPGQRPSNREFVAMVVTVLDMISEMKAA